jgi:vacuolar-type H+-ATPase subunit F/Vma7
MADSYEFLKAHFDRIVAKNREDRAAVAEQRDELKAVLKSIADRAGRRGILTLSTFDLANIRDVIAKVERAEPSPPFEGTDLLDGDENRP